MNADDSQSRNYCLKGFTKRLKSMGDVIVASTLGLSQLAFRLGNGTEMTLLASVDNLCLNVNEGHADWI